MTEASEIPLGLEVSKGLVAKFLLTGIGFIGTILFARILGPTSFGGYYLVWSIVQIAKLPIDGFAGAGKKRFSEAESNRPKIIGAIILSIFCISGIGVLGAVIAKEQIADFTGIKNGYVLLIILTISVSLFAPFQRLLAATGRVSLTTWIDFVRSLLTTPFQLVFVLLDYGAAGMAYGLSLATVASVPITQYSLHTPPALPDRATFQSLWSYARHSTLSTILGRAYSRFDIILLGFILTPAAAADYEVALKLTLPAVLIAEVAGDGLMARVSNLHSKGESIAPDITNTLSFTSILALPIFVGSLVLASPLVVTIYGPEYAGAASLLIGLALYRLVRTQTSPLVQAVNGIDHPEVNVRVSAVTLALNIVLGVALTLEFGSIGVVVATVAAESLRYGILLFVVRQRIPETDLFPHTLLEQTAAAFLMGIIVVGLNQLIPVRSWLHLLSLIGAGAVVYGATLTALSESLRYTVLAILEDAGVVDRFLK